ncbi:10264_t:CDS:2 [Gigaspora rosea]|nr:10264_t:CDS:2 [Gigaspora rosea]
MIEGPLKDKGAINRASDYYQKAADMGNVGQPTETVEEAEVFQVTAQEYFTENSDEEMEVTNWIHYTEWEKWEEESEEEVKETKYYEENKELTCSSMEQERNESQLTDIDEVYLIDLPRWGDPVTSLEFEEEIEIDPDEWANLLTNLLTGKHMIVYKENRNERLPLHLEETEDLLDGTIIQRLYEINNDLLEVHKKVLHRIEEVQQKQKEKHDQHLKVMPNFNIGDKVLVLDAKKASTHSHKLTPKWKRPYYMHDVLPNYVHKLRETSNRVFATPVNKTLLKAYHERGI